MKNQIKPIIAALLLGTTFLVNARTLPVNPTVKPFASSMYVINGRSAVNLSVNKVIGTKLTIVLKNSDGDIIYTEKMGKKATKFRSKLNMTDLPKGKYTLELNDGNNKEIRKIQL
jgi:hypothetical protein